MKGKLRLEHNLGLGPKPNVIPPGEALMQGDLRNVEIGWHPVAGFGGKWFAEKTSLGKMITEKIGKVPDPTQHWAVLVDEYVHELWMVRKASVNLISSIDDLRTRICTSSTSTKSSIVHNGILTRWARLDLMMKLFDKLVSFLTVRCIVSQDADSCPPDEGEMIIHNMREKRPAYNLISNNCQNFAVALLDAVHIGAHREFATSFAVYQRATGAGTIQDLFPDHHPDDGLTQEPTPGIHRQNTVEFAEQVMDENTTKLDEHHEALS